MKKIGILTSGGDCQSLNAAMRGVAKALYEKETLREGKLVAVPLEEVSGKLKTVPPEHEMIAQAKEIGICFGN